MSIICIGDFGKAGTGQTEVANLIKTLSRDNDIKLILGLGDNIYPAGVQNAQDPQFQEKFEKPFSKLPRYNPSTFLNKTSVFISLGFSNKPFSFSTVSNIGIFLSICLLINLFK